MKKLLLLLDKNIFLIKGKPVEKLGLQSYRFKVDKLGWLSR
ncbi:hypothetical protein KR50_34350 [Jeotgalibacillus campisalis]|uniref:Uncharacterized protein n=1 Tax=Jeotgalibacillus campisalis TaxID=220754 RepID=A0A0C2V1W9_9BACL|nr:hypothetical protein KR50_34350 [Jeotgalibacillus campisalis]